MEPADIKSLPRNRRLLWAVGALEEVNSLDCVSDAQRVIGDVAVELEEEQKAFSKRTIRIFTMGLFFGALGIYGWFQPDRYVVINSAHPIKLDRWTGRTWTRHTEFGGWQEENTR